MPEKSYADKDTSRGSCEQSAVPLLAASQSRGLLQGAGAAQPAPLCLKAEDAGSPVIPGQFRRTHNAGMGVGPESHPGTGPCHYGLVDHLE